MKISWEWKFRLQMYGVFLTGLCLWIVLETLIPHYHVEDTRETARIIYDDIAAAKCRDSKLLADTIDRCIREAQEEATARAKHAWEDWEKRKRMELWEKLIK